MSFSKEEVSDIIIEVIHYKRATNKEAQEFYKILEKDIEQGKVKIVVDFGNCEFMDSSFLGLLISTLKKVEKLGGTLKISAAHGDAQAILEITSANQIFDIYGSKDEAVMSFIENQ